MHLIIKYYRLKSTSCETKVLYNLSKMMKTVDFRERVEAEIEIRPDCCILMMCRGKVLSSGTLSDHKMNINDTVQVYEKEIKTEPAQDDQLTKETKEDIKPVLEDATSSYYQIGDLVDVRDDDSASPTAGAYFEAKIVRITKREDGDNDEEEGERANDDGLRYHVVYDKYPKDDTDYTSKLSGLRPRATQSIQLNELNPGDHILLSYNSEEPEAQGEWYAGVVEKADVRKKILTCKVELGCGSGVLPLENCQIHHYKEIYRLEDNVPLDQIEASTAKARKNPPTRSHPPECATCLDNPRKKCKECACSRCGGKDNPDLQIICDQCQLYFHTKCVGLSELPEGDDEYFCPDCKTVDTTVRPGEIEHKIGQKSAKMPSRVNEQKRDWGRGYSTAGRTKVNTQVDVNYKGAIPGSKVGMAWLKRIQLSENGIHRAPVAGIHASEKNGCNSLVLNGGYEDDVDNGDSFLYTGSGGRELAEGNKRTAAQSMDQSFTKANKGLAKNCKCDLNEDGGDAGSKWKEGVPIRVVRGFKLAKHSKYAPAEGYRYDGLYKVVKYYPETGKSGFMVYRYLLKRDDPEPAPWHKNGKSYPVIYPENHLVKPAGDENNDPNSSGGTGSGTKRPAEDSSKPAKGKKRKLDNPANVSLDKSEVMAFEVEKEVTNLIKQDTKNLKLWEEVLAGSYKDGMEFNNKVEEVFTCVICMTMVVDPVTTQCRHNICGKCLDRSIRANRSEDPDKPIICYTCRAEIDVEQIASMKNDKLREVLLHLFPGYEIGV